MAKLDLKTLKLLADKRRERTGHHYVVVAISGCLDIMLLSSVDESQHIIKYSTKKDK